MSADFERRLRRAATALETAHTARDQAILDASAAGMTQVEVAAAVGLSRVHVYRILRDHKARGQAS